ncbi:MAG: hypothetical protein Kow0010_16100 [Dehalococcoidia bacterium]
MSLGGSAASERSLIDDCLLEMAATNEELGRAVDTQSALQAIAERARVVTNADYAAVATFADSPILQRFIYAGIDEDLARRLGDPPTGRGLLGVLKHQDVPLRIDDLREHERFTGWPEGHPEMGPFIGMPIMAGGRPIGSLYMTRHVGRAPFTARDELSAAVLAVQAAQQLNVATVRDRIARIYLLEERERFARDLHDGTIQSLYALGLEVDALAQREDFPEGARQGLQGVVERLNELIGDIRSYINLLEQETPPHGPELSRDIHFAVRQLVPPGVDTIVNVTAAALRELTNHQAEQLLYITREAISNAVRHGNPTKIAIDIRQSATETTLTVQDNGIGFDPATQRTGLGTVTMRTRAEALGGALHVIGIPGMGTTVRVAIPREQAGTEEP